MRSSSVCFFCKRRKIKCDKGNPCSACVKYNESVCEYDTVQESKNNGKVNSFGGAVLDLDVRMPPRTTSSSSSTSSSSRRGTKRTSEVHTELELLKRKISDLEKSVSLSQKIPEEPVEAGLDSQISPRPPVQPLDLTPNWTFLIPTGNNNSSHSSLPTPTTADCIPIWHTHSDEALAYLHTSYPFPPEVTEFSFHNNYLPFVSSGATTPRYIPPLCWVSLVRLDPGMAPIFYYNKGTIQNRLKYEKPLQASDKVFQDKLVLTYGGETGKYEKSKRIHFNSEKADIVKTYNESAMIVGLTVFDGEIDPNADIVEKVRILLPKRNVIWLLIDRFFSRVYPYYPFLDQVDFEQQVQDILGSRSKDHIKVDSLNIKKKLDIVTCGILLLVLRLSYISVFTNDMATNEAYYKGSDPSPEGQERTFLVHDPIHIDAIEIAQQCLQYFGYLRYCNLPILQLSVFIQLYQCYAPENGEGYEDITVKGHTSMLINMAMSLGLHRDPDTFPLAPRPAKMNNLGRKLWWYLVILDCQAMISSGVALSTRRLQFDTKIPYYSEGCANVKDLEMEKTVISILSSFESRYDEISRLSDLISSVELLISSHDLTSAMSRAAMRYNTIHCANVSLESLFTIPNIDQTIYEEVIRAIKIKVHFQSHFFMISVAFHFFINFEKSGHIDHAYFYLKKLMYVAIKKMMPFYNAYVERSLQLFKNTSDIPITPAFQGLVHKCMIYIHAILLRARFSILQCETSATHNSLLQKSVQYKKRYELLRETYDLCEKCLNVFVGHTTKLGSRFYYSWRCSKAQIVLKEIRQGTDYYLNNRKGNEVYMLLTNPMLEDFNLLIKECLESIQEKRPENGFTSKALPGVFGDENDMPALPIADLNPFNENQLWQKMVMVKPRLNNAIQYSLTPPVIEYGLSAPFDELPIGLNSEGNFFEQTFTGHNYFDSLFDDLNKPDF